MQDVLNLILILLKTQKQKNFDKQFARDRLKKELCDENQIVLIEVWYFEDPYTVILRRLKELGLIS